MKKAIYPALISVLLTGCMVKPDQDQIGPYPYGYTETLKSYVKKHYFDPYSMRDVAHSTPIQGHLYFKQGWLVCIEANAKNRMGAYTGLKEPYCY